MLSNFIIFVLILVLVVLIYKIVLLKRETFIEKPDIYCIMITGKDTQRLCLAKFAIKNFKDQFYPNKKLIILNQTKKVVSTLSDPLIAEFMIPGQTLGDLRNIALQMVPINALWTVWDDDDYRSQDYLTLLQNQMEKNKSDVVIFTNRIECNLYSKFVWRIRLRSGFVTLLAKQDLRVKYKSINTMEDVDIISDFRALGKKIEIWNNDNPEIYIRLVHGNNTSLFVDKNKKLIENHGSPCNNSNYNEFNIPEHDQERILNFMFNYFKECLEN